MSTLFVLCGFTLSSDFFGKHWYDYALVLTLFGLPFVTMYNCISYLLAWWLSSNPQKATEKGYQYSLLPTIAVWLLGGFILPHWPNSMYIFPFNTVSVAFGAIMSQLAGEVEEIRKTINKCLLAMVI